MDGISLSALTSLHARWVEDRQVAVATNIAHVDTPGATRRASPAFSEMLKVSNTERVGPALVATHSAHFHGVSATSGPAGSMKTDQPIALQNEMIDLAETRRAHDLNTAISAAFHRLHIAAAKG